MIDTGKLLTSNKTLKILEGEIDPWQISSYPESGIYYSKKANWYFFTDGKTTQGVPKELLELAFSTNENKPVEQGESGFNEQLFLKTIALLSGKASDYKQL